MALQALQRWSRDEDRANSQRPASLLCRALLRGMLCEITDSQPDEWRFDKRPSGMPFAAHRIGQAVPAISLSHSGEWVAYAATFDGAVGIDVEQDRRPRDHAGVAGRAFGAREQAAVNQLGATRFYAIWTLREAIAKATGLGLAMAADGRDRVPDRPDDGSTWAALDGEDWWLMQARPAPEISLALAFRPDGRQPRAQDIPLHWWPGKA